jgi:hypothetical protein
MTLDASTIFVGVSGVSPLVFNDAAAAAMPLA